jgi:hypothetical protein
MTTQRSAMASSMANLSANLRSGTRDGTALAQMLSSGMNPSAYSPLMQRYMTTAASGSYAPTLLPRDPATFLGMQGPQPPVPPFSIDPNAPGRERPYPRLGQYPVGENLPSEPGSHKLVPFRILRALADMHDVTRRCIEMVKAQIAQLDWDIVPREDYLKSKGKGRSALAAYRQSKGQSGKSNAPNSQEAARSHESGVESEAAEKFAVPIEHFFREPDRIRGVKFHNWMKMAIEEVLVCDAFAVYEHPTNGKNGGTLGSGLHSMEILSGDTVKPLVDIRGSRPLPPNPAYQQYLWGVPRSDLVALLPDDFNDPEIQSLQRGLPLADESEYLEFAADQLHYEVYHPRAWTHYGFSNVEQIVTTINIALKRQQFHLSYFTDGDVPAMLVHVPETWNIDQIIKFEQHWHSMLAGDQGWKHRMRAVPGAQKADQLKPMDPGVHGMDFDEFISRVVCMGFFADPSFLNLDLHSSNAETTHIAATDKQLKLLVKPLCDWFQGYFDSVISRRFGHPELCFIFDVLEFEDKMLELNVDSGMLKLGALTLNEMRAKRGMEPLAIDQADEPNVYLTRDVVPVADIGVLTFSPDQLAVAGAGSAPTGGGGAPTPAGQPKGPTETPGTAVGMMGGRAGAQNGGSGAKASPAPRANGGRASAGSASNSAASRGTGQSSTTKLADALDELAAFERYLQKGRHRRFVASTLPVSIVDEVYGRMANGENPRFIFREIRTRQRDGADIVIGDLVEALVTQG